MGLQAYSPVPSMVLIFIQKLQELDVMDTWRTKSNTLRKQLLLWLNKFSSNVMRPLNQSQIISNVLIPTDSSTSVNFQLKVSMLDKK